MRKSNWKLRNDHCNLPIEIASYRRARVDRPVWTLGVPAFSNSRSRPGVVLVIVLVAVALLSLSALSFANLMLAERNAAQLHGRRAQCRALADSGLEVAKHLLTLTADELQEAGGQYDNSQRLRGVLVVDDDNPRNRGRFSMIAPNVKDGSLAGVRYGFEDESTRLNLNTLSLADQAVENGGRALLLALPGMTEEIADAILDWLDEDDEPREFGAEADYYSGLSPPYAPKNGPLDTIEELLLVRGVTPELLFGADRNRNGRIDSDEEQFAKLSQATGEGDEVDRGWVAYLTLYSKEANRRPDGRPRINLMQDDMQTLHDELAEVFDADSANFIVAYRQNGPSQSKGLGVAAGSAQLDLKTPGKTKLTTVLDLIGTNVSIKPSGGGPSGGGQSGQGRQSGQSGQGGQGDQKEQVLETPFPAVSIAMAIYLPLLMDNVTVNPAESIPGRVNINQASRVVLAGIPGMTDELLEAILSHRKPEYDPNSPGRRHETWLLAEDHVKLEQMKALMPYITGGGSTQRAQIIGYFEEGGPAARIEVILESTGAMPRIVFWRDLSHLGRGYKLETLGVEARE